MTSLSLNTAGGARARPSGWWGMAIFAAGEATLVGAMIGSYFYLRFESVEWPPPGVPKPELLAPLLLTALLAAAIVPFAAAIRAARAGRRGWTLALVAAATAIQASSFVLQLHAFVAALGRFTPQQSAYGSIYYVLLGADHAHVALGLLLDAWLIVRFATGLSPYRRAALEAAALYWLVVNGITVAVTATVLSARL